ncbi:histone deacetylase complex subunit SAP18 [Culex quinquefasciatus]|uniref:Histone deacetylase complex subunit SAP18 n=3 Tax=Culex pipiens complex TaxID=518105 RepID=B0XBD8_CULQU|nr:histone deacetylase complex subunit SAP18 [Culex quinquefasciatus]XP_039435555.1 histone deacetylase complex subunit SAP18 [Culex pipiens pallens]EDS44229.1 histone deacetylase complex subunit SAP18 [Culex quinquefasciatus]|eukprot:XP_001866960.1 histone deacetylase complex subunit SAP18 [Culex quinquefasciatus]
MAGLESMIVEDKSQQAQKAVDREKTCPLLLRVFCSTGRHHSASEYNHGNVPTNELQIYTWMDATLRELTTLVRDVNPETRRKGTYFDFAIVSPDRSSMYRMREIGVTCSGQKGADDTKTLGHAKFTIGDYMDINITPPNRMPPPRRPRPY